MGVMDLDFLRFGSHPPKKIQYLFTLVTKGQRKWFITSHGPWSWCAVHDEDNSRITFYKPSSLDIIYGDWSLIFIFYYFDTIYLGDLGDH